MRPILEQLESRDCPSPFIITEYRAPDTLAFDLAPAAVTAAYLFAGQFPQLHFGIPYVGVNQLIRWDVTPQQWAILMNGAPLSTAREVAPIFAGTVPMVFVPDGVSVEPGLTYEQDALLTGNWYMDQPKSAYPGGTYNLALMPAGPQAGQWFTPPNFLLVDWLFIAGDSAWLWWGGSPSPAPHFAPLSIPSA